MMPTAAAASGRRRGATVRTNLVSNPACSVNATGWSGLSGARTTAAAASLPRQTGWGVSSAASGDVLSPFFVATAGLPYVASIWIRSNVADTANVSISWYNSSGTLLGSDPTTYALNTSVGTQYEIGPITAPPSAVQGRLRVNNLDSWTGQVTAALVEQTTSTGRSYFDGDTAGAAWTGTAGASTSTI